MKVYIEYKYKDKDKWTNIISVNSENWEAVRITNEDGETLYMTSFKGLDLE